MAISCKRLLAAGAAAIGLLGGCDTIHDNGSIDPSFGEATRYNAALQTINPDPVVPPGAAMPGDNGAAGAAAAKRYRTDAVKPVETVSTTKKATGGGGSNP